MKIRAINFLLLSFLMFVLSSCRYANAPGFVKTQKFNFRNERLSHLPFKEKGYFTNDSSGSVAVFYDKNICALGYLDQKDQRFVNNNSTVNSYFYNGGTNFYWGTYSITNDTIKVKIVNHPSLLSPTWLVFEEWYRIINDSTIRQFAYQQLHRNDSEKKGLTNLPDKPIYTKRLIRTASLPGYEKSWIIRKNWFWANKNEYDYWKINPN